MTKEVTQGSIDELVERRASRRKSVALKVSLYYDGLGLLTCKTRDICIEGMLLDTGRVRISHSAHVEVVLTNLAEHYSDPIRVFARVNRVDESLAALTFQNLDIGTFRRLRKLIAGTAGNG